VPTESKFLQLWDYEQDGVVAEAVERKRAHESGHSLPVSGRSRDTDETRRVGSQAVMRKRSLERGEGGEGKKGSVVSNNKLT